MPQPDFLPLHSTRHKLALADQLESPVLTAALIKAFGVLGNSSDYDTPPIKEKLDITEEEVEAVRRAIWPQSNYFNTLGMVRSDFTKADNDDLAENAYFSVCEKSISDYMSSLNWTVVDKREEEVDDAKTFLERPAPQLYFDEMVKTTLRDLLRYDAAAIVKSYNRKGYMVEAKPYLGTEFWAEIDRRTYQGHTAGLPFTGWYSKGFVVHWWQRSRTGLYISFVPDEIAYMRMYPRSDNIYGTDFLMRLKYQIQYLIDSTRAAGKTFQNGVVPSIVWKHPQVYDMNQLYQRMAEVRKENQGSYRFGSILHLVRDEEVDTLSHTLHDMEWLEGQKFVSQLVWAMFGFQPEEFSSGGSTRATAYISRNVTKSKMLYPLIKFYEKIINHEILPKLEGYSKDWKFKFDIELDLDDTLKQAQIRATQAQTAGMLRTLGVKAEDCLKLVELLDDPSTITIEEIPIGMDPTNDPNAPKQPVKNRMGATEGPQASSQAPKKTPFGDSEDRQAGIKKSKELESENDKLRKDLRSANSYIKKLKKGGK